MSVRAPRHTTKPRTLIGMATMVSTIMRNTSCCRMVVIFRPSSIVVVRVVDGDVSCGVDWEADLVPEAGCILLVVML